MQGNEVFKRKTASLVIDQKMFKALFRLLGFHKEVYNVIVDSISILFIVNRRIKYK